MSESLIFFFCAGQRHPQYARAHLDLDRKDIAFLLVADGFRVFDTGEKSAWVANLAVLNLPPELRFRPELMFNFFGFSGSPDGSLEPFLRLAVVPFKESFAQDGATATNLLQLILTKPCM